MRSEFWGPGEDWGVTCSDIFESQLCLSTVLDASDTQTHSKYWQGPTPALKD